MESKLTRYSFVEHPASSKFNLISICVLLALTFAIYANSLGNDFTNWDDPELVLKNPSIRSLGLQNLRDIFTPEAGHTYQPVRVLSYALDYHFWKFNPVGYHILNILLHALSAVFLYFLLAKVLEQIQKAELGMSERTVALLASLLFVVHPVNVEAVAWISSRKYGLLAFFSLLSFYLFVLSSESANFRACYYLLSVGAYIVALLASPFALALPGLLFLYDFCRSENNSLTSTLKKWWRHYLPYCLLALAQFSILLVLLKSGPDPAIKTQQAPEPIYTFFTMLKVISDYLQNIFLPLQLNNRYIVPISHSFFETKVLLSATLLLLLGILVFRQARSANKLPLFCLGWFFITWLPAANIIPVSTKMADRYLYLAAIGVFLGFSVLSAKGAKVFLPRKSRVPILFSFFSIVLLSLSYFTVQRNQVWANSLTLWEDNLQKNPENRIAHLNLGEVLDEQGRLDEAVVHYREALRIDPYFAKAHNNLGVALAKQGKIHEAIEHYLQALRLNRHLQKTRVNLDNALDIEIDKKGALFAESSEPGSEYVKSISNLGVALALLGKFEKAIAYCKKALDLEPDWAEGHNNLANALAAQGKLKEALQHFSRALELKPDYADAHNNLAVTLARLGRFAEAREHYLQALRLKPNSPETHNNLGAALAAQGKFVEAIEHYRLALKLRPDYAEAHMNLGNVLSYQGKLHKAKAHLSRALELDNNPEIHNNLGVVFARQGKLENAIAHFTEALSLRPDYQQAKRNLQIALEEKKNSSE